MKMFISRKVREKLAGKQPPVSQEEIEQCFADRTGKYLLDTREEHQSDPPTQWFIAETYYGRKLKIVFILRADGVVIIRSAFVPNGVEIEIYNAHGKK